MYVCMYVCLFTTTKNNNTLRDEQNQQTNGIHLSLIWSHFIVSAQIIPIRTCEHQSSAGWSPAAAVSCPPTGKRSDTGPPWPPWRWGHCSSVVDDRPRRTRSPPRARCRLAARHHTLPRASPYSWERCRTSIQLLWLWLAVGGQGRLTLCQLFPFPFCMTNVRWWVVELRLTHSQRQQEAHHIHNYLFIFFDPNLYTRTVQSHIPGGGQTRSINREIDWIPTNNCYPRRRRYRRTTKRT